MKKLPCCIFVAIAFASCGDDGSDTGEHIHAQYSVPSKVSVISTSENTVYTFTYDAARRITTINRDSSINANDAIFTLFYDGGNKISRIATDGITDHTKDFLYDGNGRLNAYVEDEADTEVEITYDSVTDTYTYPEGTFSLKTNGDIKKWNGSDVQYHAGNGAMVNANNNYHILGVFMDEPFRFFACKGVLYGDGEYVAASPGFNSEELIETINLDGAETFDNATIYIEYVKKN